MRGVQKCMNPSLQKTIPKKGVGDQKSKIVQNVLKHILVLEFLKSDEILEIEKKK